MAIKKVIEIDVEQVKAMGGLAELEKSMKNVDEKTKSLRTQLREAQLEVATLSEKFGATSKEAVEAAKRAAQLKDALGDAKALTDAFNPDAKFNALSSSLSGVAGGFSAVQGAIGLLGDESKDVEQAILKVQSAMALSQGLQALGEAKDSFGQLKAVAINAFNAIKGAIGSTGIGLLVIALGAIYTYWDDIKEVVGGVSEEQRKLTEETAKDVALNKKKLDSISAQDNILKLQGKSEREILQIKIKQTDEAIKAGEAQITAQIAINEAQIKAAKRNKEILEGLLKLISLPITAVLKGIDLIGEAVGKNFNLSDQFFGSIASLVFDPEDTKKKGEETLEAQRDALTKLKNDRAGYVLGIQAIDKASAEEAKKKAKERADELLRIEKEKYDALRKEAEKFFSDAKDVQDEFNRNLDAQLENLNKKIFPEDAQNSLIQGYLNGLNAFKGTIGEQEQLLQNYYAKIDEQEFLSEEAKDYYRRQGLEREKIINEQKLNLTKDTFGKLATIFGEQSKVGKAFAVGQALINTYQGITAELATKALTPYEIGLKVVNVAYIAKTGFDSVKKILATNPTASGGGSSVATGGGGAQSTTPQFNIVGQSSTNQLADTIANKQNQPIQTYVVGNQVTTQQSLDRNAVQTATFG